MTAQFTNTTLFPGQVPAAQRAAANSLLALLGGIVSGAQQAFNVDTQTSGFVQGATQRRIYSYTAFGASVSDQWRVTPDLTLNFGVRYDLYTGLKLDNGLGLEPVIADSNNPLPSLLNPAGTYQFIGGNIGKKNQFYNSDKNNFSPVISFAYSPGFSSGIVKSLFGEKKTVLRGGYRTSYINDELVRAPDNALAGNAGLNFTQSAFNPITNTTALNGTIGNLPVIATPVFSGPNRTYVQNNAAASSFGTVFAINPNIKSPRVQEYSFGIQREVGFNTAVEIRYVGTRSKNLLRGVDYNQIDINSNGFLADFNRARANFVLTGNAACTSTQNAGCQALTVFPNLGSGGLLTNSTVTGQLVAGNPADLALIYIQNNLSGNVRFLPNPNTGVVDYLTNGAKYNYNALQVDVRRRFGQGLSLNANYTFSKNLTDAQGTGQTRFEPLIDNSRPELEFSRADYDQTHKFNLLTTYELPFGKGRNFLKEGIAATILGNFQIGGILQIGSGSPITITDARGTFNRAGRSARQTAVTNLTKNELKKLVGVYRTANGIFILPPELLGRNADGTVNSTIGGTGRGANGFDTPVFTGQKFFNNAPGRTSGLERAVFNGPNRYNLDLSLIKRFVISERYNFQIQGDLFNVFNTSNFYTSSQFLDINSTNFGRLTTTYDARIAQLAFRVNF